MYMEALISCLGEFTSHLPDYQKVEIMVFILSKIPSESSQTDILLREMLLKSLLIVFLCSGHTVRAVLSLYTSLALIAIMINLHTLPSYLALLVRIQDIALNNHSLSVLQKVNLHSLVVILFNLMANLLTLSPLQAYARQIIEKRRANASYMLEDLKDDHIIEELSTDPELMLDETRLAECLRECGLDINTLSRVLSHSYPIELKPCNTPLTINCIISTKHSSRKLKVSKS
ncbi:unnamed protein product, partial [Nesidiocoris tenuis]